MDLRNDARKKVEEAWQDRWGRSEKGEWTRRLIPDIAPWMSRRHSSITFHLTQALSGHGCFAGYLQRFGLLLSAECWYCGHPNDDARHTLFECSAWEPKRVTLESEIGEITPENIIDKMIENKRA